MIILLGATGYMAKAFAQELCKRNWEFRALSRKEINYARFDTILDFLRTTKPSFLINAAGYAGIPNVDASEMARAETLLGNTALPTVVAHACHVAGVPWGHVSSGCIYSGAKILMGGQARLETDLMRTDVQERFREKPALIQGFTEDDLPNFSFRTPPCSFYSGSKALAEEVISGVGSSYIWRLRMPFDEFDNPRNYLTKLQAYVKVYDNVNSLSHRGDFVRACLDLWERRAPFGTYNVTNPGYVTTRKVIQFIERFFKPERDFTFWDNDEEFYTSGAKTPRSNCILDVSKLLATGVRIRPVEAAIEDSLCKWEPLPKSPRKVDEDRTLGRFEK